MNLLTKILVKCLQSVVNVTNCYIPVTGSRYEVGWKKRSPGPQGAYLEREAKVGQEIIRQMQLV